MICEAIVEIQFARLEIKRLRAIIAGAGPADVKEGA